MLDVRHIVRKYLLTWQQNLKNINNMKKLEASDLTFRYYLLVIFKLKSPCSYYQKSFAFLSAKLAVFIILERSSLLTCSQCVTLVSYS